MKMPNKAIMHERHLTRTIDEIITQLNGSKMFVIIDLKMATIS